MTEDDNSTISSLSKVLSDLDGLSEEDRAVALQHLLESGSQFQDSSDARSPRRNTPAHSCQSCEKLFIKNEVKERNKSVRLEHGQWLHETEPANYYSGRLVLSKEALAQGLTRGCLLMRWVLAILTRRLVKLKSDMEERNIFRVKLHPQSEMGSSAEDLRYLSAQAGITVSVSGEESSDKATLSLYYELEPVLADQLWEASQVPSGVRESYKGFVAKYSTSAEASLRVFTDQGELSP